MSILLTKINFDGLIDISISSFQVLQYKIEIKYRRLTVTLISLYVSINSLTISNTSHRKESTHLNIQICNY